MDSPRPAKQSSIRAFASGPFSSEIAVETALPGLNSGLQTLIDQHRITLAALNLSEITISIKHRLAPEPPAPRLVCVEENPGPKGIARRVGKSVKRATGDALRDLITSSGAAAGAALARTMKKKKKKTRTATQSLSATQQVSIISAPNAVGRIVRNFGNHRHTPFVVQTRGTMAYIGQTAIGGLLLSNAAGTSTAVTGFTFDPVTTGVTSKSFSCLPQFLRNIAAAFLRYRLRRAVLTLTPVVSTNVTGSVAMSVSPEVAHADYVANDYSNVTSMAVGIQTPVWQFASIDALAQGGWSRDWKYVDNFSAATNTQASLRQESPGSLVFASQLAAASEGNLMALAYDIEIEFDSLGSENIFAAPSPSTSSPPPPSGLNPAPAPVPAPVPFPRSATLTQEPPAQGWFRA